MDDVMVPQHPPPDPPSNGGDDTPPPEHPPPPAPCLELADYQAAFSVFDRDGDGTISTTELKRVLEQLVPGEKELLTEELLHDMLVDVDEDGNGEVDFDEFMRLMQRRGKSSSQDGWGQEEDVRTAFQMFDQDGSGFIEVGELGAVFAALDEEFTPRELLLLLEDVDDDHNGKLDFDEFSQLMRLPVHEPDE